MANNSKENDKFSGFSFSFSKSKEPKKLKEAAFKDVDNTPHDTTDFISSAEGLLSNSNKNKKEEQLVIPLIQTNKWKPAKPEDLDNCDVPKSNDPQIKRLSVKKTGDSITDQAVKELTEGVQDEANAEDLHIPLLMKNKVPEGFETDDQLDVSLRPDEPDGADYDAIPIEQYGLAMLRGMGWKDGQGVGKNHKAVAPIQPILRPKGMGLGADRSKSLTNKGSTNSSNNDENLEWKNGAYIIVESGKNEGLYGQIEGVDPDDARVVVKLTIGGKSVTLSQYCAKLVTKKEYNQFSKYLNRAKVDKFKEEQSKESDRRSDQEGDRVPSRKHKHKHKHDTDRDISDDKTDTDRRSHRDDARDRERASDDRDSRSDRHRAHKHKKRKHERQDEGSPKRHKGGSSNGSVVKPMSWLRANLRVRIVDSHYKKGRHFKEKVIIEDVISHGECICRTEDGKVLENMSEDHIETVIPRNVPSYVMVVSGKNMGQIGEVLERDKATSRATVQFLSDRDVVKSMNYDSICEYVGDVSGYDI